MKSESFRDAKTVLEEKSLLKEIKAIAQRITEVRSNLDAKSKEIFQKHGWETNKVKTLAGYHRPQFDAFKENVAVEVEQREMMNLRSHLLFIEVAYRERKCDCGVICIRHTGSGVKYERAIREFREGTLWRYHFPLYVPLYLVKI